MLTCDPKQKNPLKHVQGFFSFFRIKKVNLGHSSLRQPSTVGLKVEGANSLSHRIPNVVDDISWKESVKKERKKFSKSSTLKNIWGRTDLSWPAA